ncbi:helix-turn-helix transcriptional regulator [Streptomyces sp.]|uniref:helix-turn-helix transcriptional regulator n=1 Tax=Streptomyces sp. TaxID=1931 RepID=UPI002F94C3BA
MARTSLSLPFEGRRLRVARERAGYKQEDLALLCTRQGTPVSRFQVIRAETGKNMPQPQVLAAFVKALDICLDDLLTPVEDIKAESA